MKEAKQACPVKPVRRGRTVTVETRWPRWPVSARRPNVKLEKTRNWTRNRGRRACLPFGNARRAGSSMRGWKAAPYLGQTNLPLGARTAGWPVRL